MPKIKPYDGTTDPDDHLTNFLWNVRTVTLDQRLFCIFFATTLAGSARYWFENLPPGSIHDFDDLSDNFTTSFIQHRKFTNDAKTIMGCRQREGEGVREFVARFNKESQAIPYRDEGMMVAAFTYALRPGLLFKKLVGRPSKTLKDTLMQVDKYLAQVEQDNVKMMEERGRASTFRHGGRDRNDT